MHLFPLKTILPCYSALLSNNIGLSVNMCLNFSLCLKGKWKKWERTIGLGGQLLDFPLIQLTKDGLPPEIPKKLNLVLKTVIIKLKEKF